jgi:hypothetical protein
LTLLVLPVSEDSSRFYRVKLSSFGLNDPLSVKVLIEQYSPLVLVENLLVLLVLILLFSHLISVVLPHPIYLTSVIQV